MRLLYSMRLGLSLPFGALCRTDNGSGRAHAGVVGDRMGVTPAFRGDRAATRARATPGQTVRVCVAALACLALAHCSASEKFSRRDSKSDRVADDVEIAKGGGHYKVGRPYNVNGRTYFPAADPTYRAEGIASWYGPDFHGRLTANGEIYNMHGYSAAHPTLPLPSYARITNLSNGKSMIVRVNNRGPFVHNRLIDLSVGTAKALGFYGHGLARVRVEYVGRAPLEGSDDRMLLATLREGSPAPAPSPVMVASATPFLPSAPAPLPVERPFALGSASTGTASQPSLASSDSKPAAKPTTKPASKSAAKRQEGLRTEASVHTPPASAPTPTTSFAPAGQGGLGLMSGRGLY